MTTTTTWTAAAIATRLEELNLPLIRRVLRVLGSERTAAFLDATLAQEAAGGTMRHDGQGRRTPGGAFFDVVKGGISARERARIFLVIVPTDQTPRSKGPTPAPRPPRPKVPQITVDGVVLAKPFEARPQSYWCLLKLGGKARVRAIIPTSAAPVAVGQRFRVTGSLLPRQWPDGEYPTLSGWVTVEVVGRV